MATETVLTEVNLEHADDATRDDLRCFPLRIRPLGLFSDDQFYEFCRLNCDLRVERTSNGDLLIMAPASFRTSHINLRIVTQLHGWAGRDGTGLATESSGGFILPNSAVRAPDAAWTRHDRLNTVPPEEQDRFLPLCPDFAMELLSLGDTLGSAQAKMSEYLDNGLRLGWLIDPFARRVHVYRPGLDTEVLDDPEGVDGDPVLPGFNLDLTVVWQ